MGCPRCGVVAVGRGRKIRVLHDVPGEVPVVLRWRQRTWRCPDPGCPVGSFTEQLPDLVRPLRDDARLRFEVCTGVSGVHWPQQEGSELHAVYHFQSITHGVRRVRFEVTCPDDDPRIPSIVSVYPANDWHERETWDMFGIVFEGHPGLTRILMPDDWPGHPQRKDYPLGGIPVEYKGASIPAPDQRRSYT